MFSLKKTLKKLGKNFGLLAAVGALAALTPEAIQAAVEPLGVWAPMAVVGINAAITAARDWLKHRKPAEEE